MARTALALLVALLALGALTATASADPLAVIDDCQDGVLDEQHSRGDLRDAKRELQGDTAEYTSCVEVIDGALKPTGGRSGGGSNDGAAPGGTGAGGTGGTGTFPGGTALPPEDPAAFADENGLRRDASGVPVDDKGEQVDPASFAPDAAPELADARRGVNVASAGVRPPDDAGTRLPTPLIVLLVAGVLAALATLGTRLTRLRSPRLAPLRRPAA